MDDIKVSIFVPTFNHQDYIVQALDSILMQKVDFNIEVLVGEDCSTDNTRQVLKNYEMNHPDAPVQYFYRTSNMRKQSVSNSYDLKMRCKGKYIIGLEGDDYWTDQYKLKKQVEFLDNHPEYIAVAHNCIVVDKNSEPTDEKYPECKDNEYSIKHFASRILPGQYTTLLLRNIFLDDSIDKTLLQKKLVPGDQLQYFTLLCYGKIYCFQEKMSAYRHIIKGGSSFSATYSYKYEQEERWYYNLMKYAEGFKDWKIVHYPEYLYFWNIRTGQKIEHISISESWNDFKKIKHKSIALLLFVVAKIRGKILKKTLVL